MGASAGGAGEEAKENKQPFPLEKILTASLGDFLKSSEGCAITTQTLYGLVGVHEDGFSGNGDDALTAFAKKVPPGALVITDYRRAASPLAVGPYDGHYQRYYIQSGTAIVPKPKAPNGTDGGTAQG